MSLLHNPTRHPDPDPLTDRAHRFGLGHPGYELRRDLSRENVSANISSDEPWALKTPSMTAP